MHCVLTVPELVSQAKEHLSRPDAERSEACWHAYVCIEFAILNLKLAARVEAPAIKRRRKRLTPEQWLAEARAGLDRLDLGRDSAHLLQDLRECREPLKHLVANYDKGFLRSITS